MKQKEVPKIINIIKTGSKKDLGYIFNNHWFRKKKISNEISNAKINNVYNKIVQNKNFYGGKLIGAGGGGFFLFVIKNKKKALQFLKKKQLNFREIKLDYEGSRTIRF